MKFVKGAHVTASDGEKIGSVDRVVIDPETKKVSHLVVGEGVFFATGKVIPIDLVSTANEDGVTLKKPHQDLNKSLPAFEEAHFVELDDEDQPLEDIDALYWYPPVGGWWNTGNILGYAMPQYVVKAERNIPEDKIALREGADVITEDGEVAGQVEKYITEEGQVTHLVVKEGFLFAEKRMIPSTWIRDVREHEVLLSVGSGTLTDLPDTMNNH